jgi:broad specificity phosphatase PhoE
VTTFFLVRHALHVLGSGVLAGRNAAARLSEEGHRQAAELARRLRCEHVTAVHSSPQQRTLETARLIAQQSQLPLEVVPALDEVDFGSWAGKSFAELDGDSRWACWNAERDIASTPGGDTMRAIADRITGHMEQCRARDPEGCVVLVSHAEPIRAAILHYRRLPFREFFRVEIDPASITQLVLDDTGATVPSLNERVAA